jgi:hypothetical protein
MTTESRTMTNEDLTDEELDHERECCRRFLDAHGEYIRIVEEEPDSWFKANAALEELWAAYQASPCACDEKPASKLVRLPYSTETVDASDLRVVKARRERKPYQKAAL